MRHNEQVTRPYLDAVIEGLKERGIKEFGATGYCFGGASRDKIICIMDVQAMSTLKESTWSILHKRM